MKKTLIIILCLLSLCACSGGKKIDETVETSTSTDAVEEATLDVENNYPEVELNEMSDILFTLSDLSVANAQYSKFATELFKNSFKENENGLISPYSLYAVLSILTNGANNSDKANTKLLLENVLGLSTNDLNKFYSYTSSNLDIANGLLFNTDFGIKIDDSLRSTIKEYYGDSITEQSFADVNQLVNDVNKWSMQNSNGSIPTIIDNTDIQKDTIMLLLNGLSVEGEWGISGQFDPNKTVLQEFKNSDKSKVNVSMMKQTINGYWQTEDATGFTKDLVSGYTFVGILPNEDVDINEFIKDMDENDILDMIDSYVFYTNIDEGNNLADKHYTNLSFPKLKYSVTNELDETLKQLGLNVLFDDKTCDFSSFGDNSIYLQNVKQKTNVEVNEKKVKMSAITVASGGLGAAGYGTRDIFYHDVTFDRPFIYALLKQKIVEDGEGNYDYIIMFIGTVNILDNETEVNKTTEEEAIDARYITVDSIKIRSTPTTKENNVIGYATMGKNYLVYEIKEYEAYTWYRIAENAWIADDGTWTTQGQLS